MKNSTCFIGREKEKTIFFKKINSEEKEMIVLYGRRRVGKTELIANILNDLEKKEVVLKFSGSFNQKKKEVVYNLKNSLEFLLNNNNLTNIIEENKINLEKILSKVKEIDKIEDFFYCLRIIHRDFFNSNSNLKFIVSIDEISYLSNRTGFLEILSHHWNEYFCNFNNVKFILTGSVVSWIKKNISNARNGLHNRVTEEIFLKPFTLKEVETYIKTKNNFISNKDIFLYYLCFGGIPYYLSLLDFSISFNENIEKLFSKNGKLRNEFETLCNGLFEENNDYKNILEIFANEKSKTFSSNDILNKINAKRKKVLALSNVSKILMDLEKCEFIQQNLNLKENKKEILYSISDPFVYFYVNYLEKNNFKINDRNFEKACGFLFELFCFNKHNMEEITDKLLISGLKDKIDYFYFKNNNAQIDLLMKRPDNVIMLIECKFYNKVFTINDNFVCDIENKINELKQNEKFKKELKNKSFQVVVCTFEGSELSKNLSYLQARNYKQINFKS